MKRRWNARIAISAGLLLARSLATVPALAQAPLSKTTIGGTELQMILTVADHMSHKPAPLKMEDIRIMGGTITGWTQLDGVTGGLEVFLLIDDAASYPFGSKLAELRRFVAARPAGSLVGVAYIHEGVLEIAQGLTADHAKAAAALHAPAGGKSGNLYCALSDLIGRWESPALRREIVLVSAGIDETASGGGACTNADMAIHDAERAGVVIFALYHPVPNYRSETWAKVDAGVVDLAHVCYETGGEAYFMSHDPVDTLEPFLADVSEHMAHQYLVKFRMAGGAAGDFQKIYLDADTAARELMKPDSVWLPGTKQ